MYHNNVMTSTFVYNTCITFVLRICYDHDCRQMSQLFCHHCFKSIIDTHMEPIYLRIGTDKNAEEWAYIIFIISLCNDNMEAYDLSNCNMRSSICKCRICNMRVQQTLYLPTDYNVPFRNGPFTHLLTCRAETVYLKYLKKAFNARGVLTVEEKNILQDIVLEGLVPGFNALEDLFAWLSKHDICDFFSSQIVDLLHTCYKGICDYVVRYVVHVYCTFLICLYYTCLVFVTCL
jgi:hypothetical protein